MLYSRHRFYLAPDSGGGNSGSEAGHSAEETRETGDTEAMKKELDELRKEKAEREKKAEEERQARMSEEEKAKAEIEKERSAVLSEYRTLQLQSAGLDDGYASLITGNTADEIRSSGELIRKLIDKVKAETEAAVKKEISKTKAPGTGDGKNTVTDQDYYESILKGGN